MPERGIHNPCLFEQLLPGVWIPDSHFAASGMTAESLPASCKRVARARAFIREASTMPSELHRRRSLVFGSGCERFHRLAIAIKRRCPDHARPRLELGVVRTNGFNVVAPRHRDAVLGA